MNLEGYNLSQTEQIKLINGIKAALAIPFIDSLEDFIWEGVFCYMKGLKITDYLLEKRKKLLFDVTDDKNHIGWSAKSLQCSSIRPNLDFELVIQRADILKKRNELGFPNLTLGSPTSELGRALLKHWNTKIEGDSKIQKIDDGRICVLLITANNKKYAYFEEELARYTADEIDWKWTDDNRVGLQGIRKSDGFCVYRWYHNQKQFFERFQLNQQTFFFDCEPRRLVMSEVVELLNDRLLNKQK
jgi:hypothetical protein